MPILFYKGQIITMAYLLVENDGLNQEDMESTGIHLGSFMSREYQLKQSNWRMKEIVKSFLENSGKIGVDGTDTRALTRCLKLAVVRKAK